MPNPEFGANSMTLAAQVLSASALRKKGRVRAIVYSYSNPQVSGWMHDEAKARDFLFSFAGSGTRFPFDVLRRLAATEKDVLRVIISDWDFVSNVESGEGSDEILREAARRSRLFIVLLSAGGRNAFTYPGRFASLKNEARLKILLVDASKLAETAAHVARTILGD
jgi:hypothetical protein